jgi:Zn-dependent protease
MNPDELVFGFLEYVVFLLSTTCHEASHALAAKMGGDSTAAEGGQVTLNPIPHIRREPFGMVAMPLIGIVAGTGLIGWASAPYNRRWALNYPKRAAWMSLAGPAANFSLCIVAAILMRIGLALKYFEPGSYSMHQIVDASARGGVAEGIGAVLSIFFSLNLLLGCFNLLPFPPLDGYGVLGLFTTEAWALRLEEMRMRMGAFSFLGLLLGWRLFGYLYDPLLKAGIDYVVYLGYRLT